MEKDNDDGAHFDMDISDDDDEADEGEQMENNQDDGFINGFYEDPDAPSVRRTTVRTRTANKIDGYSCSQLRAFIKKRFQWIENQLREETRKFEELKTEQ